MREQDTRAAPRLRFTKEELQTETMENASAKTKEAMKKTRKARDAAVQTTQPEQSQDRAAKVPADNAIRDPEPKPQTVRLQTERKKSSYTARAADTPSGRRTKNASVEKAASPIRFAAAPIKPAIHAVKQQTEKQLSKYEDENTGLQAAHTSEQALSSVLQTGIRVHEFRQHRLRHREEQTIQAPVSHGLRFEKTSGSPERPTSEGGRSNPLSRKSQRQNIQKGYRSAKTGKRTGNAAGKASSEAAEKASSVTEKIAEYVGKRKHVLVILLLGFLLLIIMQGLSACSPLLEAGLTSMAAGTYPAEQGDILAAEQYYTHLEQQLQDEMQRYEIYHPGFDEYAVTAQEIWHDPYALIALISAYRSGEAWTLDDAIPIMQMLFEWQYELTETVTNEQRFRTEYVDGEWIEGWFPISVCTVALKNKNLSHAPVYVMSREKVSLYALYMSTHGNMEGLFYGPHVFELTEPLRYEVPRELMDADPQFARLIEEAEKYLGYPYVWGGYAPDTSFDCSGFISWIFTATGVRNIGHMGATGLYDVSRKITENELKPGDVIFFAGTIPGEEGITHCALYVGNGMMIHCGSPCSYYDIAHGSLRDNIAGYGRFYEH